MMELPEEAIQVIHEASAEADPREACGVILKKRRHLKAVACKNYDRRIKKVRMNPAEVYGLEVDGWAINAFWHSHVRQGLDPSDADLVSCKKSGVPWLIYGFPNRRRKWIYPEQCLDLPLVGREFHHGVVDCYTLIRDYFKTLRIHLPDFNREDDWWMRGENGRILWRKYEGWTDSGIVAMEDVLIKAQWMWTWTPKTPELGLDEALYIWTSLDYDDYESTDRATAAAQAVLAHLVEAG